MSDGSPLPKTPCRYCRVVVGHIQACPGDNPVALQIWNSGYSDGVNRKPNRYTDDPTYTLGYVSGELFLKEEDKRMRASEPPPRVSIPGDVELALALHERRHIAPSIRPAPPGQAIVDQQVASAESVIY